MKCNVAQLSSAQWLKELLHFGHQLSKSLLVLMLEIEAHGVSLVVDSVDFWVHVGRNALEVILELWFKVRKWDEWGNKNESHNYNCQLCQVVWEARGAFQINIPTLGCAVHFCTLFGPVLISGHAVLSKRPCSLTTSWNQSKIEHPSMPLSAYLDQRESVVRIFDRSVVRNDRLKILRFQEDDKTNLEAQKMVASSLTMIRDLGMLILQNWGE